jgi:hypothetical protein
VPRLPSGTGFLRGPRAAAPRRPGSRAGVLAMNSRAVLVGRAQIHQSGPVVPEPALSTPRRGAVARAAGIVAIPRGRLRVV